MKIFTLTYTADVEGDWTDAEIPETFTTAEEAGQWWATHYRGADIYGAEAYPSIDPVEPSSTEAETTEWAILAHLRSSPGDTVARLQLADLWEESGEADLIARAGRHRKIAAVSPTGPLTEVEKAQIRESYAEFWECDPEDIRITEGYDAAYGVHFFDVDTDSGRKGDETTYLCCEVAETSYDRLCR